MAACESYQHRSMDFEHYPQDYLRRSDSPDSYKSDLSAGLERGDDSCVPFNDSGIRRCHPYPHDSTPYWERSEIEYQNRRQQRNMERIPPSPIPCGRRMEYQDRRGDHHKEYPGNWERNRSLGRGPEPKVTVPTYNGKTRWKTFIRQYEVISADWSERKKLQHLLANLKEDAAEFAFDLDQEVLDDYQELVDELEKRFDTKETRETHVRQFYNRKFKRGDTVREFASDLKRLIRKAYPTGISRYVMEDMLLKQFFDGFNDEDLHYYVQYLKSPERLDEAVELVYEYDERRNIRREELVVKDRSTWKEGQPIKEKIRKVDRKESVNKEQGEEKNTLEELTKAVSQLTQSVGKLLSQDCRSLKKIKPTQRKSGQSSQSLRRDPQQQATKERSRKAGKVNAILDKGQVKDKLLRRIPAYLEPEKENSQQCDLN